MNVERLNRILIDLNDALKKENTVILLQEVRDNLQNQVNQPNQPVYQTELVKSLEKLYENLIKSAYNNYSPSWKEIINEIGHSVEFGDELKRKIESIFSSNVITPAKALEDINELFEDLQNFQTAINNTLSGFETLGIEEEILEDGECELGYTIPREFIDNELSGLKKEISELNFILNHISEAVTGKKEEFKVKTISSSDFLLYILISLNVADVLSKATERILNHYKQILEIKSLRNQLKEKGVPAQQTKGIESYANGIMKEEIKAIAKEVIEEYYKGDKGRKNELENSLEIALNKLANRIDKGFNVEIRVEPLPAPKDKTNETEEYQKKVEIIKSIQQSAKNIEYIENNGESILQLPEIENNDE